MPRDAAARAAASQPSAAGLLHRLLEDDESLLEIHGPKVEALLIQRLYHNSLATRYMPIPMLFGAFFVYRDYLTWWQILGLTTLYLGGTWYLDRLREDFSSRGGLPDPSVNYGARFAAGCAATGLVWGLLGWLAYPPGEFALQAVLCVAWAGLAISALNTRAVHLPSFYVFMTTMSVPLFTRGYLFGEPSTVSMAFFGTILLGVLCLAAQVNNKRERFGAALRLRNAELIGKMDRARLQAETGHADLQRQYHAMQADFAAAQRLTDTGFWAWDAQGAQVTWSDTTYHLLGLAAQSCPAALAAWLDCTYPDDREAVRDHYHQLRAGAGTSTVRFRLTDGVTWLQAVGESLAGEDGQVQRIRGILRPDPAR